MKKILSSLNQLAELFEANNEPVIASEIHDVFMRVAKKSTEPNEMESGHKSAPKGYPKKKIEYADPKNFKYPIDTEKHARAAWSYIHQERNRKGYTSEELAYIESRIKRALKKFDVDIKEDKKASVLRDLNIITASLENSGDFETADSVHNVFMKLADKFKPEYQVEFPMNLDDALNNYDSGNYEVDAEGDWEEAEPIDEFRSEISDEFEHAPAAVDDNHIIFENPENDHIEVMNMIPKHHLDTLHKNDD
jgi:hypothetical protein